MELNEAIKNLTPQQRQALETMLQWVVGNGSGLGARLEKPADGIEAWLNKLKVDGYSPRTVREYEYLARKYLVNDPKPTPQTIRAHLARRLDVDKVSEVAVRNDQKALKSLFTFLYEEGLWGDNPMAKIKLIKERSKERECPDDEQVFALIGESQLMPDYKLHSKIGTAKFKTLIRIICDTGLRVTEAASIKRDNISLDKPFHIKVEGKGKKERTVYIGWATATYILMLLQLTAKIDSPYLFPGKDPNRYWDVSSIQENMRRVCDKLGIKPITPHQLRHWWATRTLQNGGKLEVVSRLLGHSSVGITGDVYRHVSQSELAEEHQRFSPLDATAGGGRHKR